MHFCPKNSVFDSLDCAEDVLSDPSSGLRCVPFSHNNSSTIESTFSTLCTTHSLEFDLTMGPRERQQWFDDLVAKRKVRNQDEASGSKMISSHPPLLGRIQALD